MDRRIIGFETMRLSLCRSLQDINDLLDIYLEFMVQTIENHNGEEVHSYADRDAKMVMQMMFSKVAHVKKILEGIQFQSTNGIVLNNITDPTTIGALVRSIYETVAMFNLIYRQTKTEDEKTILYNLWAHAGLKFRQRFEGVASTPENQAKMEAEKIELQQLADEIRNTDKFKSLLEKDQNKIETKLKEKDFKIFFDGDNVIFLSWQEIISKMEIKNDLLDHIYTYFSLYAHPSNVAVFQFSEMFNRENPAFQELTNFNIKNLFVFTSIFIADFINLFPTVKETFDKQNIISQIVLNYHNRIFRGDEYSIIDAHKTLE